MPKTAIIIGAGLGGMAAALRLRARGYHVHLVERQATPGGRATSFTRNGFAFDAGPTIITAPFLLEELFSLFGRSLRDRVDLRQLDPWYRVRFHDGETFTFHASLDETLDEIRKFDPSDVDGYLQFLEGARNIYEVGFERLGDQPFSTAWSMAKLLPRLIALEGHLTVYSRTSKYIKNSLLRQAFSFHPLLVGGNPLSTTSIYSLIHYLERRWGVHFAMGGTGAIVRELARLMDEVGIRLSLGVTVEEIIVEHGRAAGVRLENGTTLRADIVVANADPPFVYKRMIPQRHRQKWSDARIDCLQYSMGLFVLYFGTTRRYPELAHHEILLGPRYEGLLGDIFDRKRLAPDMSLYLHTPSRSDAALAPAGCESMYALVPVPNLQGQIDWSREGPNLRQRLVDHLASTICPGLHDHLVEDFFVTPEHFSRNLLSLHGTGFSVQPLLRQSAYFRFHNQSEDVGNLYFVGAGTHPGAGVPGVLLSAKVLERLLFPVEQPGSGRRVRRACMVAASTSKDELPPVVETASRTMAGRAKTFYWAARLLPRGVRRQLATLYAFCRYVDDLVDTGNSGSQASRRIERVRQDVAARRSETPVVADFLALAARAGIPDNCTLDLLEGVASDLGNVRFNTIEELVKYCYRVAGTVGIMICHVFGVKSAAARLYAVDLGIAMQLTNIARDVAEDFAMDRMYLPREIVSDDVMGRALLSRDEDAQRGLHAGVTRLLDLAGRYYRSADNGIGLLPFWARWGILTASRNYEAIGTSIRQSDLEYWRERVSTSKASKLVNTVIAIPVLLLNPRYWPIDLARAHDPLLHKGIACQVDAACAKLN